MKIPKKFLAGTIVGGAVGSIIGLMVAPKSGKALRADIAHKASDIRTDYARPPVPGRKRTLLGSMLRAFTVPKKTTRPPVTPPKS